MRILKAKTKRSGL